MANYTTNQKETISISSIRLQLAKCDKLDTSFLSSGDKEPSWDGDLYLHKTNKLKAEGVVRIPVQIKGTENFDSKTMKFRVERHHLVNYKKDNGVFYIVVQVNSNNICDFYYSDLLSPDLDLLLKKNKGKYAYLKMKWFDTSSADKIELILRKFANAREHLSAKDTYVENPQLFDEVVFNVVTKNFDLNDFLFEEQVLFGKINNFPNKLVPILKGTVEKIDEEVYHSVSINGKEYYSSYIRTYSKNEVLLSFGKALKITVENLPNSGHKQNITFNIDLKLNRSFFSLYDDSRFIEALIESGNFEVDNQLIPVPFQQNDYSGVTSNIKIINNIKHLYNILKISKDFDFSNLTDKDTDLFQRLIDYFVNDNHKVLSFNQNGIWSFKISNLVFRFLVFDFDSIDGPNIKNIFTSDVKLTGTYTYDDKIEENCSYFFSFTKTDFVEMCNIDYQKIKSEIFIIEPVSTAYITLMINYALEVLKAYDISNIQEHVDLCECIIDYLSKLSNLSDVDKDIIFINECQLKKRLNTLEQLDLKKLFRLELKYENVEDAFKRYEMLFSINVLTENFKEAQKCFDMIEDQNKEAVKNYPIYKLYKEPII